ncbi:AraC family transcriptional regulator [Flammeovirga pectinis]|uniref:AraC family transcriptional regulator n=1 Tax=Flammeovirga pectinis TaxID=2494373 RepID=A0A3S9P7B9_9BACT|nr:AraC family transcriptional regulator [Flammeovirga pectinis]AZQ64044.1 AraC family transcriptional regulator [Flammeovirga pectinis]
MEYHTLDIINEVITKENQCFNITYYEKEHSLNGTIAIVDAKIEKKISINFNLFLKLGVKYPYSLIFIVSEVEEYFFIDNQKCPNRVDTKLSNGIYKIIVISYLKDQEDICRTKKSNIVYQFIHQNIKKQGYHNKKVFPCQNASLIFNNMINFHTSIHGNKINSDFTNQLFYSRIIIHSFDLVSTCLYDLLQSIPTDICYIKLVNGLQEFRNEDKNQKSSHMVIHDVHAFIIKNYHRNITNVFLAKKFNMSISSLLKNYKKVKNSSPKNTITELRIEAAKKLIKSSNYSLKEIAYKVGFDNYITFNKSFKNCFGTSPTAFLNEDYHSEKRAKTIT